MNILSMDAALWGGIHQHVLRCLPGGLQEAPVWGIGVCIGMCTWVPSFARVCEQLGHGVMQAPLFLA